MKKLAIIALSPSFAFAGPPSVEIATAPAAEYWIRPTIDIRARYEIADAEGFDTSNAFTFRERLGLKTQEWNGFLAFIEGEFTQAAVDDYSGGAPGVDPMVAGNTVIADPESNELNQAYLQYSGSDSVVKVGRQRIIYDNAAFIGNVGWRQNEQTYDAASLVNTSIPDLTFKYAYVNQVNRIFGSDADGFFGELEGNLQFVNASYTGVEDFTFAGYTYLMDFKGLDVLDNATFGGYVKTKQVGLDLYGELAFQTNAGVSNDVDSNYAHLIVAKTHDTQTFTAGFEYLAQGFRTPLATLHAFNGYADVFLLQRTFGDTGGLNDYYLSHSFPLFCGVKMTNTVHAFGNNDISATRGWEIDSVLAKKFDEHFTAISKLAYFHTESSLPTTTRFSVELTYTF